MTNDKKEKNKEEKPSSAKASASVKTTADKSEDKKVSEDEGKLSLEECKKQRDEYLAGWQRARADLLNYKKEEMERFGQVLKFAGEEFVLKVLPILDNFNLIEKKLPEDLKEEENIKGVLQLKKQIEDFLKSQGVEEIKISGEKFDPNFQEAVETIEKEDMESGTILEEIQKGYTIHGRVLRPAKVKVIK
jgi:molecular chaperone GrpE